MRELIEKLRSKEGWMDGITYEHELGHALGGNVIYPSRENLVENVPCAATDPRCAPTKVYVISADELDRLMREDT